MDSDNAGQYANASEVSFIKENEDVFDSCTSYDNAPLAVFQLRRVFVETLSAPFAGE